MHEQIPFQSLHSKQIQALDPDSRSSLQIAGTPLIQNHFYEQIQHNYQNNIPILFTNQQLHDLITTVQKVYQPDLKVSIEKYISMVMHLNNIAHFFIYKLQNKQKRVLQNNENILTINSQDSPNPNLRESNTGNLSPHPLLNTAYSDKLEVEILMMLNEAERILQYAAGCGKNIDRKLIICVLNNQACFYQKIWDLQKSCSYIQAAIINLQQWGQQSNWSQISSSNSVTVNSIYSNHPMIMKTGFTNIQEDIILMNMRRQRLPKSQGQFSTKVELAGDEQKLAKNYELVSVGKSIKNFKQTNSSPLLNQSVKNQNNSSLMKKDRQLIHHMKKILQLSVYYLQYTSLCGQLNFHDRAIQNAKKVITKIKKILQINRKYYINYQQSRSQYYPNSFIISQVNQKYDQDIQIDVKKMIFGLSQINDQMPEQTNQSAVQNYRQAARYYLKQYQSVHNVQSRRISACQKVQKNQVKNNKLQKLHKDLTGIGQQAAQKYIEKGYKYEDYVQMMKIRQQIKSFTISDILQIRSKDYKYLSTQNQRNSIVSKDSYRQHQNPNQHQKHKYMNPKKQRNSIFRYLPDYLFSNNNSTKSQQHHLNYSNKHQSILFGLESINNTATFPFLYASAILFATSYFVLATQLRLQAAKDQIKEGQRFEKKMYKQSQIYHLMAILILAIYVPLDMAYLRHIVSSYENYYVNQISPIDEMMSNEYGNGPNSDKKISFSNISLRSKFDKQGIYKYPKAQTRKQKELITNMKKAINKQIAAQLKVQQKPIIFPKLSKKNTINEQETHKQAAHNIYSCKSIQNKQYHQQSEQEREQIFSASEQDEQYENSQQKIYQSLFDMDKRKKMKINEMKKKYTAEHQSHKRSKSTSKRKQTSKQKSGENYAECSQDAYGHKKNRKNKPIRQNKQIIRKITKKTQIIIRSNKGSLSRVPYSMTTMPSPQKLNNARQNRKLQFSSPKAKIDKSVSKSIQNKHLKQISHSISVLPNKTPILSCPRKAGTNKNSLLQNKFAQKSSDMIFDKQKQRKKSKIFKSPKQKKNRNNRVNQYRLNIQKGSKNNRDHAPSTTYQSKQRVLLKSKSKSYEKTKKRGTQTKVQQKKQYIDKNIKKQTEKIKRYSQKVNEQQMSEDCKNLYFQIQENDPDIYKINTNKNYALKTAKKAKKNKQKQKRANSRVCSPSSKNSFARNSKNVKQSPKIITNYSSNLSATPNSLPRNQASSSRKLLTIN